MDPATEIRPLPEQSSSWMLIATLHCSDPGCDAEVEIEVAELSELDGWPCDCGYGLLVVSVAELVTPYPA